MSRDIQIKGVVSIEGDYVTLNPSELRRLGGEVPEEGALLGTLRVPRTVQAVQGVTGVTHRMPGKGVWTNPPTFGGGTYRAPLGVVVTYRAPGRVADGEPPIYGEAVFEDAYLTTL